MVSFCYAKQCQTMLNKILLVSDSAVIMQTDQLLFVTLSSIDKIGLVTSAKNGAGMHSLTRSLEKKVAIMGKVVELVRLDMVSQLFWLVKQWTKRGNINFVCWVDFRKSSSVERQPTASTDH